MIAPTRIVEVLLPLALAIPYSYSVPEGMALAAGDYVRVPLGTRELDGVVWGVDGTPPKSGKLRGVLARHDLPPMPQLHRDFIDWVANYYLEPKGGVLRLAIRAPGAFEAAPERIAFRLSETVPEKLTSQRQRVVDMLREGPPLSAAEIKLIAGVGASVVKGLQAAGVLVPVSLPGLQAFAKPD
ncbi:MAG: primosomal protein N', partial [Aestuariivirgaceae bacterium]|nr:primosomal protein N' [Aestuariivirgaceae bacterium]